MMGCSSSNSALESAAPTTTPNEGVLEPPKQYPASEAFIIKLHENATTMISLGDTTPVKVTTVTSNTSAHGEITTNIEAPTEAETPPTPDIKPPPKRIQQLLTEAAEEPSYTLETLEEKLNKAEERRKELLQQKIENIQKTMQMNVVTTAQNQLMKHSIDGEEDLVKKREINFNPTLDATIAYARDIKAQALDDDSKRQLLCTGVGDNNITN